MGRRDVSTFVRNIDRSSVWRVLVATMVAMALATVSACSSGDGGGDGGDRGPGDRVDARVAGKDVKQLAEVRRLLEAVPDKGQPMDASEGAYCDANRQAARADGFVEFREAVRSIEPALPGDMARRPRMGYGVLLHTINDAEDRAAFRAGIRALDDDARRLVHNYKKYGDRLCGRLAPDAEALA